MSDVDEDKKIFTEVTSNSITIGAVVDSTSKVVVNALNVGGSGEGFTEEGSNPGATIYSDGNFSTDGSIFANGTITVGGNVIVGNDILAIGTTDKDIFVKTGDGITDYTGSVTIGGTGSTVMVPKLDIGRGNVVKVREVGDPSLKLYTNDTYNYTSGDFVSLVECNTASNNGDYKISSVDTTQNTKKIQLYDLNEESVTGKTDTDTSCKLKRTSGTSISPSEGMVVRGTLSVSSNATFEGDVEIGGNLYFSSSSEVGIYNLDSEGSVTNMDIQIGSDSQTVRMRNMEIGQFGSPTVTISELGVITTKNLYIQGNITSNNANKEIFADVTKDIFIGGAGSRVNVQNLQVGPENSGVTFTQSGTTTIHGATTVTDNVEVTNGDLRLHGNITCKDGTCGTSRCLPTLGTSVTIGGETTRVEIPGSLEIGVDILQTVLL